MSYIGNTKIGKMYLGNTEIAKAYLGNDLVFQKGGVAPTLIPYIRGGADGSYIDTGITADNTVKVVVWARNVNPHSGWLFGSRIATQQDTFGLYILGTNKCGGIRINYGQSNSDDIQELWGKLSHYHKYELYDGVLKIDDVTVGSASPVTFSNDKNIYLLGLNNNGSLASPTLPFDICACKIYKGGTLVRDYTATNSPSAGLYDAVSGNLFTNAGGGSFSYGEFNPNAYTPLEYVSCSGAQYFDSGIKGTYSLGIVCKCMPTAGAVFHELLGYRSSNSCCCIGWGNTTYANARVYWRFGANETTTYPYEGGTGGSVSLTNQEVVIMKSSATISVYKGNTSLGSAEKTGVSSSFQTTDTLYVGRTHNHTNGPFRGRLYFCGFGSSRNYVPAKVNNVAGMYDTYNDTFKPSMTETAFTAGPTL